VTADQHDEILASLPQPERESLTHLANFAEEVTHVYPSSDDFPWWIDWMQNQVMTDQHIEFELGKIESRHQERILMANPSHDPTVPIFGLGGWTGNIKHLPYNRWNKILNDNRLIHYNSFLENYETVGTARNPYSREFTVFLYYQDKVLQEKTKSAKSSNISKILQDEWDSWTSAWPELPDYESLVSRAPSTPGSPPGYGSQASALCDIQFHPDGSIEQIRRVRHLLKTETLEEDYINFCDLVGMEVKGPLPHLLSIKTKWEGYLPKNVLDWYTDESLEAIHRIRWLDFEGLDYKKVGE